MFQRLRPPPTPHFPQEAPVPLSHYVGEMFGGLSVASCCTVSSIMPLSGRQATAAQFVCLCVCVCVFVCVCVCPHPPNSFPVMLDYFHMKQEREGLTVLVQRVSTLMQHSNVNQFSSDRCENNTWICLCVFSICTHS